MTMTKKLLFLAFFLLLAMPGHAQDIDLNAMTSLELQAYVQQLQQEANQPVQPTIITIQADRQLTEQLNLLQSEVGSMKDEMSKMQERFNRLVTDTQNAIDTGNEGLRRDLGADMRAYFTEQTEGLQEYINQKTNPVRQNAPAIGVFLILTGAFLLWASKQYKLTQGVRNNGREEKRD